MARSWPGFRILGSPALTAHFNGSSWINITGIILDGATEKIGLKYIPQTTSPITAVDLRLNVVGTPGNFRVGIFTSTTGASQRPDTQLGGWSGNFSPSASGFTGMQTLGTDTGTLTLNTPVWIVVEYVSGTIDGSNYIQPNRLNGSISYGFDLSVHHNGTDWTTTATQTGGFAGAIQHADGTIGGWPLQIIARSSVNDIWVNGATVQVQGLQWRCGAKMRIKGFLYHLVKSGSPGDLVAKLFAGDTEIDSTTVPAAFVATATLLFCWFPSPTFVNAGTVMTILLSQSGTSDSNDYDLNTFTVDSAHIGALVPPQYRFIHGDGLVPSALTLSNTQIPYLFPVFDDEDADFDEAVGGGGVTVAGSPMRRGTI